MNQGKPKVGESGQKMNDMAPLTHPDTDKVNGHVEMSGSSPMVQKYSRRKDDQKIANMIISNNQEIIRKLEKSQLCSKRAQ